MLTLLLFQASIPAPTIDTWLNSLPSLGIGGVLAAIMFFFYRSDRQESEKKLQQYTENFVTIIQDNTKAMTSLADAINRLK